MLVAPQLVNFHFENIDTFYIFSDFDIVLQLLGGIFLVASFIDYTNQFVDNKIVRIKESLNSILKNLDNRYSADIRVTKEENIKLTGLQAKYYNKKVKIQVIRRKVDKNTLGLLINSFLDKYLYFGLYCLVLLVFCAAFETKILDYSIDTIGYVYYFIFFFNIFSFLYLLFLITYCIVTNGGEIPVIYTPLIFVGNAILSFLPLLLISKVSLTLSQIVIPTIALILIVPIIHSLLFLIIELSEYRVRTLEKRISKILQSIVEESIRMNGNRH